MVANTYRQNLLTAWKWGTDFVDELPQYYPPFQKVQLFPSQPQDRYVPPDEEFIKVLREAKSQDLAMLLAFYFTGARRNEILRLTLRDVNLEDGKIRLTDNKAGQGKSRIRWLRMHPELIQVLSWWKENRPCEGWAMSL